MNIKVEYRIPTVQEYQQLRGTTNWGKIDDSVVSQVLSNTQFAVCFTVDKKIVASGRIIGDGAYFYIQDVIVLPNYRGKGIGRRVMLELENWIHKTLPSNTFVGLMAAEGTKKFYEKFDYKRRSSDKPGMSKVKK